MKRPDLLAMKRSLTSLGLGVHSSFSVGFWVCSLGKLRPKRMPEQPMSGSSTELNLPSELRAVRYCCYFILFYSAQISSASQVFCRDLSKLSNAVTKPPYPLIWIGGGALAHPVELHDVGFCTYRAEKGRMYRAARWTTLDLSGSCIV